MKYIGKYKIPKYAICAIENGDFSGLDEEDIDNIKSSCMVSSRMGLWQTGTSMSRMASRISPAARLSEWQPK